MRKWIVTEAKFIIMFKGVVAHRVLAHNCTRAHMLQVHVGRTLGSDVNCNQLKFNPWSALDAFLSPVTSLLTEADLIR